MGKKITMGAKPQRNVDEQSKADADRWVEGDASETEQNAEQAEKMKRLTIDIPEILHRELKISCATRGIKMADIVRELIEKDLKKQK